MKIIFTIAASFCLLLLSPVTGCGQGTPPASATGFLDALIVDAKTELARFEAERKAAADKLSAAPDDATARTSLVQSEASLRVAGQKLTELERAQAAVHEQGPIGMLIADLKRKRDALPTTGPEAVNRSKLDRMIDELENIRGGENSGGRQGLNNLGIFAIVSIVLLLAGVLFGLGYLWIRSNDAAESDANNDGAARVRLAKAVTLGSMTFIVLVAVVILLCAGVNAAVPPQDEKKTALFFDISKWVLATVLPVVAGWVSGVMAYYFGKDNFKAGAENAVNLIQQLTPQQRLEAKKASASGLPIAQVTVTRVPAGTKLEELDLNKLRADYKAFERLPILDDTGRPLACLHLSRWTKYMESLSAADKANPAKVTLGALINAIKWKPEASFATVSPADNLATVQGLIKDSKECSDVFVTADGTRNKAVDRWITNDDIVHEAAG